MNQFFVNASSNEDILVRELVVYLQCETVVVEFSHSLCQLRTFRSRLVWSTVGSTGTSKRHRASAGLFNANSPPIDYKQLIQFNRLTLPTLSALTINT